MLFSFFIFRGNMITDTKKKIHTGKVIEVKKAAKNLFYIKIFAKDFEAKAGQFIAVLCGSYTLRRPFSVIRKRSASDSYKSIFEPNLAASFITPNLSNLSKSSELIQFSSLKIYNILL